MTFCIGLSFRSGDFNETVGDGVADAIVVPFVMLVTMLLIDSDDPFDAVDAIDMFDDIGPTYFTLDVLELCAKCGDIGDAVLFILELFCT